MINVLVVDDQNLTHRLIATYLEPENEIDIVGFADNGEEAIEQIQNLHPDVVLMDVDMPKMDGLSATKIITKNFLATKVVILTVYDNEQHLSQALKNGAKGYLLKTTTAQELKNAIYNVNQGYFQLSLELIEKYLHKIIKTQAEFEENLEFKRKINYLYKSLTKLERRLEKVQQHNNELEENLEHKIESLIQKEMALLKDRDSHLQFKVDRMKYNQERLEQNVKYLFKIQLACILAVVGAIIAF